MNKKTKALIAFLIWEIICANYKVYEQYKQLVEINTEKSNVKHDLNIANFKLLMLKSNYKTLYNRMTDEEKEKFRLLYPYKIPSFIDEE